VAAYDAGGEHLLASAALRRTITAFWQLESGGIAMANRFLKWRRERGAVYTTSGYNTGAVMRLQMGSLLEFAKEDSGTGQIKTVMFVGGAIQQYHTLRSIFS